MAGGRPTRYSKWVARAICMRIMDGESLRSICERKLYPSKRAVLYWLASNEEFMHQYTQAREIQQENFHDEMFEIADDARNDWMERLGADGEVVGLQFNSENVQRSRLRIDTRKWVMERMAPKRYGSRQEIDHKSTDGSMRTYSPDDYKAARGHLASNLKELD